MKKILLSMLFAFCLSNYLLSQIMVGEPYYFCALNGSCYNNDDRKVTIVENEYTPTEIVNCTETFNVMHPEFNIIEPASMKYNCHGYAYSVHQGEELNEFYDYLEIIRLHESLNETNRTALQLYVYEVTLLEDIAENGTGASKAMADAILAENRGFPTIAIPLCPTIPDFASVARGSDESEMTSDTAFKVELSPNPATTNVEVSYTLPEGMTSATLVMTNILGVNVMTAHLDGNNGETTLGLEELPSGIYFYTIQCGEDVKTGKLVKRN